jgi:hypothetical protein
MRNAQVAVTQASGHGAKKWRIAAEELVKPNDEMHAKS